eukprot:423705-Pleurochrysis_carterae.AAC.1
MFSPPTIPLITRRGSEGKRTAKGGQVETARRPASRRGLHRVHPPDRPEGFSLVGVRSAAPSAHTTRSQGAERWRSPMAFRLRSSAQSQKRGAPSQPAGVDLAGRESLISLKAMRVRENRYVMLSWRNGLLALLASRCHQWR